MSSGTLEAFFDKLERYIADSNLGSFHIVLHGGEPLLAARKLFDQFIVSRERVANNTKAKISASMQTNGLLLTDEIVRKLVKNEIRVGLSLDGPEELHDEFRLDHAGRGTHTATENIARKLIEDEDWSPCFSGVLCVINPKANGSSLVQYFYELGIRNVNFLVPDENHDNQFNTPDERIQIGTVLRDAYDQWRAIDDPNFRIVWFEDAVRYFLNDERPKSDTLSGNPIPIVSVETDGEIQPLDVFKCCGEMFASSDLDVKKDGFGKLNDHPQFKLQLDPLSEISDSCVSCEHFGICGGGYLPHRLGLNHFQNRSIYCDQLTKLYDHIKSDLRLH